MDIVDVGGLLRKARKEKRLTQSALAATAGLTRSRIDAIENGRAADVGIKYLLRAMNAVGLDLRVTALNENRPTFNDLVEENEEEDSAPRMG